MRRVLIIANLFHASPRIIGLVKYLQEFGWKPIILTVPIGVNRDVKPLADYVEVPYNDVLKNMKGFFKNLISGIPKKGQNQIDTDYLNPKLKSTSQQAFVDFLHRLYERIFYYPDAERYWKEPAIKAASKSLESETINAIISSSSPVTCHLIAKELTCKYKLPWIADLRDLWSLNHAYPYGPLRHGLDRRLELKTLSSADVLVTVTPSDSEKMKKLHEKEVVYTITNGFDPDNMSKGKVDLTSKFTITYTGQIYKGKQDPSKLLVALRDLIYDGTMNPDDVEVRFYGTEYRSLTEDIKEYDLSNIIKTYGKVPRQISFEKQRESQMLLFLNWEDQLEKGVYSLKIFEYLAAQRPIIATGGFGGDVVEKLIEETKAGVYCKDVENIRIALSEMYSEYKHKGKTRYNGDIEKINKYSYREMARKFAEILDRVT